MSVAEPDLVSTVEHGVRIWRAGAGSPIVAIAGPPTSALLFRHLARPLAAAGHALWLPEVFHPPPASATVEALVERLAPFVTDDAILLVHGLALPIGLGLASRCRVRGLALLDGPLEGLDPVTRVVAALAQRARGGVAATILHPGILNRLLASSAGLRRAVVNPYAMDRDIVAVLSAPLVATAAHRQAVATYLASLRSCGPPWPRPTVPVVLLWGAEDLLYPMPRDPSACLSGAPVEAIGLPGARFLDVEERPWEVAEALLAWVSRLPTATRMS